ncbi:HEAT repeat domain-containing protein [Halostagnicola sp. A-GB9-2]|uniref:HEAT repeat domain-containing protein n=1 Tax=Halostagnicola sp. A-GB9-2 TaxID=3048066 RepID=UPI0024C0BD91|nr:HEAT repeat domain-containing protein [Halostagnicola sp. A-GB9-2]MDJ1433518.1 HEAT repeat domain-containing protein [Halostagnicola sp. A-GB9-2]
MDSDGEASVERYSDSALDFELPTVLAQLDSDDPSSREQALETVRSAVDTHPEACLPTVPKLRKLLSEHSAESSDAIAYCLAELAYESPDDVAPSTSGILSFLITNEPESAARDLFRSLHAIAEERPDTVIDHVDELLAVLEGRETVDRWGVEILAELSREYPTELTPAIPILRETLARTPQKGGVSALSTLGRVVRAETTVELEFVDDVVSLVDHDDRALRNNAIACLGDIARTSPSTVEASCPTIAGALESEDPNTRANAAVTIGRVAAETNDAGQAQQRLLELLSDDHAHVRANACTAIGYGEVEDARDTLEVLAAEDPNAAVRERAAWASAQL